VPVIDARWSFASSAPIWVKEGIPLSNEPRRLTCTRTLSTRVAAADENPCYIAVEYFFMHVACATYKHRLLRICADYLYPEELLLLLLLVTGLLRAPHSRAARSKTMARNGQIWMGMVSPDPCALWRGYSSSSKKLEIDAILVGAYGRPRKR
jgi:hypothetical protein